MSRIPSHLLRTPSPLINRFVDYINHSSTEYIEQYSVFTAFCFFSHLYSRQYIGETGLSTGIYGLLVGKTGIGKNYCKEALSNEQFEQLNINQLGGVTSASGLFTSLVRNPSILMVSDEIGDKINSNDEHSKSTWRLIREISNTRLLKEDGYSGRRNGIIEEKKDTYSIKYPALTMLGMTTPKQLTSGLSNNDIENGTVNRLIIIDAEVKEIVINERELIFELSQELMLELANCGTELPADTYHNKTYSKSPKLKLIKFSGDDRKRMSQMRLKMLSGKNSEYTVRSVEKAIRLAMIITISKGLETILTADLDWCIEYELFWSYNVKKVSNSTNQTVYSENIEKLKNKLKNYPEGLEKWKINKFIRESMGLEPYKRDLMIKDLEDDGLIEWHTGEKSLKNGKAKKMLCYIGDKRK